MLKHIVKSATAIGFAATVFTASAPISLADSNISTQGPDSGITAKWSNKESVSNDNDVSVTNSNCQTATSGNATVSNNTSGGSATSGNASNNNSSRTQVSINNGGSGGQGGGPGGQGGGPGGTTGTTTGGKGGGQVLGASFTVASLGGGLGGAQLPNTGMHQGLNPWIAIAILTILASGFYWRYAILPKLK